ncbi:MAG: methyltransferase [Deltaproteobacteria bacterium]|nr:methyltransferase [Deltaproteobacteria bacterium]
MRTSRKIWMLLLLAACGQQTGAPADTGAAAADSARLAEVLGAQSEEQQARYAFRHPQETLEFLGIAPGMTVVEVLPGAGWYSKILLAYLGQDGLLIGADYSFEMVEKLGFLKGEGLAARKRWVETWTQEAESWRGAGAAPVSAFVLGSMPEAVAGTADAVLFIRALHNLNRVEAEGGYLTAALADAQRGLEPGGILGVVQHEARSDTPDAWADGSNGYLKRDALIARLEQAGFEYLGATEVNANPKDRPNEDERSSKRR